MTARCAAFAILLALVCAAAAAPGGDAARRRRRSDVPGTEVDVWATLLKADPAAPRKARKLSTVLDEKLLLLQDLKLKGRTLQRGQWRLVAIKIPEGRRVDLESLAALEMLRKAHPAKGAKCVFDRLQGEGAASSAPMLDAARARAAPPPASLLSDGSAHSSQLILDSALSWKKKKPEKKTPPPKKPSTHHPSTKKPTTPTPRVVRKKASCKKDPHDPGKELKMGWIKHSLKDCAELVHKAKGKFFAYGKSGMHHVCKMYSKSCSKGFSVEKSLDFYDLPAASHGPSSHRPSPSSHRPSPSSHRPSPLSNKPSPAPWKHPSGHVPHPQRVTCSQWKEYFNYRFVYETVAQPVTMSQAWYSFDVHGEFACEAHACYKGAGSMVQAPGWVAFLCTNRFRR